MHLSFLIIIILDISRALTPLKRNQNMDMIIKTKLDFALNRASTHPANFSSTTMIILSILKEKKAPKKWKQMKKLNQNTLLISSSRHSNNTFQT